MFDDVSHEEILERIFDRVPDEFDKREGSVLSNFFAPVSQEMLLMYIALGWAYDEAFADTAGDDGLERRALERGLTRYPARAAKLKLVTDVFVPNGTRFFASESDLTFEVLSELEPNVYEIECESTGLAANGFTGELVPFDEVENLTTATVTETLSAGSLSEDIEEFRSRYLKSIVEAPTGGNAAYYLAAVGALDGVGGVRVIPVAHGPGTVGIIISTADHKAPSAGFVASTQTEVDASIACVDHLVTVTGVRSRSVNVATSVTLESGAFADIKSEAESVIGDYLHELSGSWQDKSPLSVFVSQIEARILSIPGVIDVSGTTLNGVAGNLTLDADEVPILGTVSG